MGQDAFGGRVRLVTREANIWTTGVASAYAGEGARG